MPQKSLGLIETIGLAAGIEAADAAVKSANVTLIGYELSKGSGMTVVKVEGDVGAVKAAISAATVAAAKVGRVVSTKVIARPSESLEVLVRNGDTVGYKKAKKATPPPPTPPSPPSTPSTPEPDGTPTPPKGGTPVPKVASMPSRKQMKKGRLAQKPVATITPTAPAVKVAPPVPMPPSAAPAMPTPPMIPNVDAK